MPVWHLLLAVSVVAVWGTNFVVIRSALDHLPPFLLATLRFALACIPAVFFLRRPPVPWGNLAAYGVLIGAGQFGLMYLAITRFISPGLASLVVQVQVFFTIGLSMWLHRERVRSHQVVALLVSVAGIAVILRHLDGHTTATGLLLMIGAALGWSGGNLLVRAHPGVNMLAYVAWASLFSVPPLLGLSLALEGWATVSGAVRHASPGVWAAVLWQTVGNTLFGYAVWGWLVGRHPAATIMPLALLVPVFGLGTSAWLLGEPLPPWKLAAAGLVLGGLALNLLWPLRRSPAATS